MKKAIFVGLSVGFLAVPLSTSAMMDDGHDGGHGGGMMCSDSAQPLLTVADFDGDGMVDGHDYAMLRKVLKKDKKGKEKKTVHYSALFDRNGDRTLDDRDLIMAKQDMGESSTAFDQEVAAMYERFRQFQFAQGDAKLMELGYQPIPVPLKGHGVHWFNEAGFATMLGKKLPDAMIAEGLNVQTDDQKVHGLFWAYPAVPVFADGATDYPQPGGAWQDQRVIAFSNTPEKMTSSEHENWHAHAGLCMTVIHSNDANGNLVRTGYANQHLSFNECQALPNDEKQKMFDDQGNVVAEVNMWATFWMIHMWMFDPNPNGFFAGTHPCVEPHGLDEDTINGDREVPMFFKMMH